MQGFSAEVAKDACVSDLKDESCQFCVRKYKGHIQCFHDPMGAAERGDPCRRHPNGIDGDGVCGLPAAGTTHVWYAANPCQPFTSYQMGSTLPEEHKDYASMYGDSDSTIATVKLVLPAILVVRM